MMAAEIGGPPGSRSCQATGVAPYPQDGRRLQITIRPRDDGRKVANSDRVLSVDTTLKAIIRREGERWGVGLRPHCLGPATKALGYGAPTSVTRGVSFVGERARIPSDPRSRLCTETSVIHGK